MKSPHPEIQHARTRARAHTHTYESHTLFQGCVNFLNARVRTLNSLRVSRKEICKDVSELKKKRYNNLEENYLEVLVCKVTKR